VTEPKEVDGGPRATAGATRLASSKRFSKTLVQQPVPTPEQNPSDVDAAWETPAQPGAGQVVEPAPDPAIGFSGSDTDVSLESNPVPTQSGASDVAAAQEEPAHPAAGQVVAPAPEPTINLSDSDADLSLDNNPAPTQSGQTLDARTASANEPSGPGVLGRRLLLRRSTVLAVATGLGAVALALTVRAFVHRTSASPPTAPAAVSEAAVPVVSPPDVPSAAVAVPAAADSATSPPNGQPAAPSAPPKHRAPRKRPVGPKSGPAKSTR
jgi:hypothetical protein